ncbi:MAG: hypothetical protein ABI574_19320 [Burkholderiales bacterium]
MKLIDYLRSNAIRCAAADADADVIFFGVRKGPEANADALKAAMKGHKGEFCDVDPLDGREHSYLELGGWVGDQGAALELIGLGAALGAWKLRTPKTMLGDLCPPEMVQQMAGMGMVSMQAA